MSRPTSCIAVIRRSRSFRRVRLRRFPTRSIVRDSRIKWLLSTSPGMRAQSPPLPPAPEKLVTNFSVTNFSGLRVYRAGKHRLLVILPMFVEMNRDQIASLAQRDVSDCGLWSFNDDLAGGCFECFGRASLCPDIQLIAAEWQFRNAEFSRCRQLHEIRRLHDDDNRAHSGVDVAEDVADSRFVEHDGFRPPSLVKAKIKFLAVESGENIVEERILIRKIHGGADLNCQQSRQEALVLLDDLRSNSRASGR